MGGGIHERILGHLSDGTVKLFDLLSLGAVVATFLGWLPQIAAGLSVVWIGIRIVNEVIEHRIKLQQLRLNRRELDK